MKLKNGLQVWLRMNVFYSVTDLQQRRQNIKKQKYFLNFVQLNLWFFYRLIFLVEIVNSEVQ